MQPVIIIGLTSQGLSLLRAISKAGLPLIAFIENKNKKDVGYYSKYGDKRLFSSANDLKSQLLELAEKDRDDGPLKNLLTLGIDHSMILIVYRKRLGLGNISPFYRMVDSYFDKKFETFLLKYKCGSVAGFFFEFVCFTLKHSFTRYQSLLHTRPAGLKPVDLLP